MGAVYSVELRLAYTDKAKATEALASYVAGLLKKGVRFSESKDTSSIDSMMEMLLVESQGGYCRDEEDGYDTYSSGFTATYSWSEILDDMFEVLLPYLVDDCYYYQSCDSDYDEYTTKNRKKIILNSSWRNHE